MLPRLVRRLNYGLPIHRTDDRVHGVRPARAGLASLVWIAALSRFQLSYAYPLTSFNFVLVVGLSVVLFGEHLNVYKILGIAAICSGLVFLGAGSR